MTAISSTIKIKTTVRPSLLRCGRTSMGFLFEPALALILAPTPAAPFILLLFVGGFLARQPLKFLSATGCRDAACRAGTLYRYAVIYRAIAGIGFIGIGTAPITHSCRHRHGTAGGLSDISGHFATGTRTRSRTGGHLLTSSITVLPWRAAGIISRPSFMGGDACELIPSVLCSGRLRLERAK